MNITIEKTAQLVIDTSIERKRITKAFRNDPVTQKNLNKFMDLVEACEWEKAGKELESKWWNGYDDKAGCPRFEFIGLIENRSRFFSNNASYIDLVYEMNMYPKNYRVVHISK